ncbi:MAG: hypothetical protein AAGI03_01500 [Pseudomonadota bacterium]
MPFLPFKPEVAAPPSDAGVKASLQKFGKTKDARLCLTFTQELIYELGWETGDKLAVLIGDGSDHGILRLRKDPHQGVLPVKRRTLKRKTAVTAAYFQVSLGTVARFVNRREKAQACTFEQLDGGWFEIVLPRWADETAPKGDTAAEAAEVLLQAPDLLPKWGLEGHECTLIRYLLASGRTAQRDQCLAALRETEPNATADTLTAVLGRVRRKLDAVSLTVALEKGGAVRLLGHSRDIKRLTEAGEAAV